MLKKKKAGEHFLGGLFWKIVGGQFFSVFPGQSIQLDLFFLFKWIAITHHLE